MKTIAFSLAVLALGSAAFAAIKTETVEYKDGDTVLEGFIAYDDSNTKLRPGVLVIHDWTGLQDYAKRRTAMVAELGYVAFAADVYGKGVRPTDPKECGVQAGTYKNDLPLLRRRVMLALGELKKNKLVQPDRLAAIGYCFGGTSVLELARSGADVRGVVSFHGGLGTKLPAAEGGIKARVLICHGADDPFVKPAEVDAFKDEMAKSKAKMKFVAYPGAVHSFTKKEAGDDPSKGQAYNERADAESWAAMKKFLAEIFG
ncbi:MAG: dienelactone hydrolase family protein [Chthoniobacteraceae bacterium]